MTDYRLIAHPSFAPIAGPVVLVVMDGVGVGPHDGGDAVYLARTPHLDGLIARGPATTLRAHGRAVGLPSDDDMGNSEVGHNAMGAGRVFDQGAKRVNQAIESGELFEGETWRELVSTAKANHTAMHFIGLLSDGNVHSHIDHLFAMIRAAAADDVASVRVHVLLDGRDVPETSALDYVRPLEALLAEMRTAGRDYRVASGGGRMRLTMDRYNADWAMVERGYRHHVLGEGRAFASATTAIETLRDELPGVGDQNLPGFVIVDGDGQPVGPIRDGAAVVFFNFRGDRAIEISRAFVEEGFEEFDRERWPQVRYAGMMQYDGDLRMPPRFLVEPPSIDRTLGQYLAHNRITQLACSETQKFGHVTYFWNGNRSGYIDETVERYVEVPSDTRPFEQRPWMKAAEITDVIVDGIAGGEYRHIRLNYANGDMVGHTGSLAAAVMAVEAVDLCLGRLIEAVDRAQGALVVTADHGNADDMFERDKKTKQPVLRADGRPRAKTSHSLNPVPFMVHAPGREIAISGSVHQPGLANIAASILLLLGYSAPDGYEPSVIG